MDSVFQKIISLAKRRGFIYPGSELYGGLANTYDYGPMGTELMRNIRNAWWKAFVSDRSDMVGLESSLISHHKIWEASGHVGGFADAMIDCKNCKARFRADHLIEDWIEKNKDRLNEDIKNGIDLPEDVLRKLSIDDIKKYARMGKVEGLNEDQLDAIIFLHQIQCLNCKKHVWTKVRKFNQLFPVQLGIVVGDQSLAYLRGETAQGMFVDFKNIVESTRVRLPFGVAQNGKSFRNEITPGNSVFRTLVFEQAEIEYFFDPETSSWEELFENWKKEMWEFVIQKMGVKEKNLRWRRHTDEERSFYSKRTEDMEYNYPFGGFKELWGLAYRTDYDLSQHQKYAGTDLTIIDPITSKKILPHVIEPAVGIDRIFLMVLCDAYVEEAPSGSINSGEAGLGQGRGRTVLKIAPCLAPYKAAIFPLLANKPELVKKARGIYDELKRDFVITFDSRGNIGKRYMSQDEIGTPFCVTVDFDTLNDNSVTVRDRDTMKQERVKIENIKKYLDEKI